MNKFRFNPISNLLLCSKFTPLILIQISLQFVMAFAEVKDFFFERVTLHDGWAFIHKVTMPTGSVLS